MIEPRQPGSLYVGASTKMYLGYRDSLDWLAAVRCEVDARPALKAGRVVPFVVPSFPMLPAAGKILAGSPLVLGAQNCGWSDGPWTGEVSPSLLAELGVGLVEVGHAERRRQLGENAAMIVRKVRAADDAGVTALLCVGEGSAAGEEISGAETSGAETAAAFVHQQIQEAVDGDWNLASRLVIAYEPVWAIGAAEPASATYVSAVVRRLRHLLGAHSVAAGSSLGELPVIYGGSAKPGLLPTLEGISGLFLGRYAHDAANFGKVLDEALRSAGELPAAKTPTAQAAAALRPTAR